MWPQKNLKILVPRTPPDPPLPPWHPPGGWVGQKWPKCIPTSPILKMNSEKNIFSFGMNPQCFFCRTHVTSPNSCYLTVNINTIVHKTYPEPWNWTWCANCPWHWTWGTTTIHGDWDGVLLGNIVEHVQSMACPFSMDGVPLPVHGDGAKIEYGSGAAQHVRRQPDLRRQRFSYTYTFSSN